MKKKKTVTIICILVLLAAAGGTWFISDSYRSVKNYFPENTIINGIDCSGDDLPAAKNKLIREWRSRDFEIMENGKKIAAVSGDSYKYNIDPQLKKLLDQGPVITVWNHYYHKKRKYKVSMDISAVPEKKLKEINSLECLNRPFRTKTKDAYVELNDTDFDIISEVYGDNTDKSRFIAKMKEMIAAGKFSLDYKASDYYDLPETKKGDKKLSSYREWCKKNLSQKITYRTRSGDMTISPRQLKKLLKISKQGDRSVNKKAAKRLIDRICEKQTTAYKSRKFRTHSGNITEVYGGDYGWIVDSRKEEKRFIKVLKTGKDKTLKPIYIQKAYYKGKGSDIGNSYIEVDLSAQELYLFKKGNVCLSCSVVTGKVADGHGTPQGTYGVDYLQRDTVLRGNNTDGSKYESNVSYWMPFNGGIGLHDAPWRGAFGGNIYYSSGSHGCVNMPVYAAADLFSQIEAGYPVVVHY